MGWSTPVHAGRVVVIDKGDRTLCLLQDGREVARYPVSLGLDPVSDKVRAHDLATPEGRYFVTSGTRSTRFFRTLALSYPNLVDAQHGLASGLLGPRQYRRIARAGSAGIPGPCGTALGCGIALHGGGVVREGVRDWTEGCVALDNPDMDRLAQFCRPNDAVVIFFSRGNLYRLLRPFAAVQKTRGDGLPDCPATGCAYEVWLDIAMGRLHGVIREGGTQGTSLQVALYAPDRPVPVLELLDRNADGHLSYLDEVRGPLVTGQSPDDVQTGLRNAVVAALRAGVLPVAGAR